MPRIGVGDAEIKIDEKGQTSCSFSSISSTLYVWSLKLGQKMPNNVHSLLVKPKLKNLLSVLHYKLPRFRGKGQNQRVATF